MKLFALAILIACFETNFGEKVRYDNYRVYSVEIETDKQLKVLLEFESTRKGVIFFETPSTTQQTVDIAVSPHDSIEIIKLFKNHDVKNRIEVENLQKLFDEEQSGIPMTTGFGWNRYHNLTTIYNWLDELLQQYPSVLTNYNYGISYQNRTHRAVKVSYKQGNPTIFIESTIHAREWITAATATYFLNELLTSTDENIRKLAESYDWVFVPVMNIDGYAFTHSTDRLWRKNRTPSPKDDQCIGTDLNRNFDYHHLEAGSSTDPCGITYAGPKPFSEAETLALSKFVASFKNIKLYLAFHSYSQLILFPYGLRDQLPDNYDDLYQISDKTRVAIGQRYNTSYTVGTFAEALYPGSGTSVDWVYAKRNVSLAYTIEMRDKGKCGFILPPDQIIPNALEIIDGLEAMIKEAVSLHYL